jgi:hypothetical protein
MLLPLAMAFAVVATGNHYQFDSLTGVVAALIGLWFAIWRRAFVAQRSKDGVAPGVTVRQSAASASRAGETIRATPTEE